MRMMVSALLSAVFFAVMWGLPPQARSATTAAPADEYFGRMHMSILGIRNELAVLDKRVTDDPVHAEGNIATCELVEDALEAWATKYPQDSWLQGQLEQLESVYAHVSSLEGRLHLARLVLWAHEHLAGSPVDADARVAAAKLFGVPLHSDDPVDPAPAVVPVPVASVAPQR
jgi:hypothetical protein